MIKISLLILSVGLSANAMPYKYSSCEKKHQIEHPPEEGKEVYFSKDCSTAYVLPPKKGKMRVRSLPYVQVSPSVCSGMSALQDTAASYKRTFRTIGEIVEMDQLYLKDSKIEKREILADMPTLRIKEREANSKVEELKGSLSLLNEKISEKEEEIENCKHANICHVLKYELADLEEGKSSLISDLSNNKGELTSLKVRIDTKTSRIAQLDSVIEDTTLSIGKNEREMAEIIKTVEGLYSKHLTRTGALLNVEYELDHSSHVNRYVELNSDVEVRFVKMPARFSKLHPTVSVDNNSSNSEDGGPYSLELPATTDAKLDFTESTYFNMPTSGTLQLSLNEVAACRLINKENGEVDDNALKTAEFLNLQNMYQFEVAGAMGYSANFNVKQIYERIKESGSSGGFFSSRSWSRVINNNSYDSLFTIKFHESDSQERFTTEQQNEIIRDEKKLAIDQLFKEFLTMAANDGSLPISTVGNRGKNGAQAGAEELAKCPHLYCQIGASALTVLDSIFGSAKATSYFRDTKKFDYNKDVNIRRIYLLNGASGYVYE